MRFTFLWIAVIFHRRVISVENCDMLHVEKLFHSCGRNVLTCSKAGWLMWLSNCLHFNHKCVARHGGKIFPSCPPIPLKLKGNTQERDKNFNYYLMKRKLMIGNYPSFICIMPNLIQSSWCFLNHLYLTISYKCLWGRNETLSFRSTLIISSYIAG